MSKFDIFEFHPSRVHSGELFPSALERDAWVFFHGTSSNHAELIEEQGFTYANHPVCAEDVASISQIFLDMDWVGSDLGGFGVLSAFSKNDLQTGDARIFFGETGTRSLLYATQDFAGGEKMRAIRRAWRDLELFLSDNTIREKHYADKQRQLKSMLSVGAAVDAEKMAEKVDLDWLETRT